MLLCEMDFGLKVSLEHTSLKNQMKRSINGETNRGMTTNYLRPESDGIDLDGICLQDMMARLVQQEKELSYGRECFHDASFPTKVTSIGRRDTAI